MGILWAHMGTIGCIVLKPSTKVMPSIKTSI